eukprot:TRINITY_DN60961_c0_g1_i1.p1 TRINITY_DN60961_c0_g1~~TRINITY_DN60961_c0_g1_i1.p1  ORF type:complete len:358 (+),score=67.43 TRINITY_DN60961_c0_g1_i1:69-1142(+)
MRGAVAARRAAARGRVAGQSCTPSWNYHRRWYTKAADPADRQEAAQRAQKLATIIPPKITAENVADALACWVPLAEGCGGEETPSQEQRECLLGASRLLRVFVGYTKWLVPVAPPQGDGPRGVVTFPAKELVGEEGTLLTLCPTPESFKVLSAHNNVTPQEALGAGVLSVVLAAPGQSGANAEAAARMRAVVFNPLDGATPGHQVVIMAADFPRVYSWATSLHWEASIAALPQEGHPPPPEDHQARAFALNTFYVLRKGDDQLVADDNGAAVIASAQDAAMELAMFYEDKGIQVIPVSSAEVLQIAQGGYTCAFTLLGSPGGPGAPHHVIRRLPADWVIAAAKKADELSGAAARPSP